MKCVKRLDLKHKFDQFNPSYKLNSGPVDLSKKVGDQIFTSIISGHICLECGEKYYEAQDVGNFELAISSVLLNSLSQKGPYKRPKEGEFEKASDAGLGTILKFVRKSIAQSRIPHWNSRIGASDSSLYGMSLVDFAKAINLDKDEVLNLEFNYRCLSSDVLESISKVLNKKISLYSIKFECSNGTNKNETVIHFLK